MITRATIQVAIMKVLTSERLEPQTFEDVAESVIRHIAYQLQHDGLIITQGGPHLLDANDKTVWRAEPVAGVAAHVDPDSPSASGMIARRFARRT